VNNNTLEASLRFKYTTRRVQLQEWMRSPLGRAKGIAERIGSIFIKLERKGGKPIEELERTLPRQLRSKYWSFRKY
jgi:hypothetical protein